MDEPPEDKRIHELGTILLALWKIATSSKVEVSFSRQLTIWLNFAIL